MKRYKLNCNTRYVGWRLELTFTSVKQSLSTYRIYYYFDSLRHSDLVKLIHKSKQNIPNKRSSETLQLKSAKPFRMATPTSKTCRETLGFSFDLAPHLRTQAGAACAAAPTSPRNSIIVID